MGIDRIGRHDDETKRRSNWYSRRSTGAAFAISVLALVK